MKKGNPVVGVIIGAIFIILLCFFAYTIYCVVYKSSKKTDFAYLGDYTTYINTEDNLSPDYNNNDLIIVKRESYYSTSQVVLYNYNNSYRLGKVVKTSTSKYYIGNSMSAEGEDLYETTYENIIGSANTNIKGAGTVFKIFSSVGSMVILVVMVLCYMMFAKEK